MNKSELVEAVAGRLDDTKANASRYVDTILATLTDALQVGDQVTLPGFGSFSTKNRAARTGRNPQTGQLIQIKASRVPHFKAGKTLKEAVQERA